MSTVHAALLTALLSGFPLPQLSERSDGQPPSSGSAQDAGLHRLQFDAEHLLAQQGLEAVLTARVKDPASVMAKAVRKGVSPDQLLDRWGLRVRVNTVQECYRVQALLHERYPVIPGSEDDYIAGPKDNGYQSLHSAVRTPYGVAEFQVRTHAMHEHAEHGGAAHWLYKADQADALQARLGAWQVA